MFWIEFWPLFFIVGIIAFTILTPALSRSRFVARRYVNPAYKPAKCPHCTVGAQYLDGENGWGPIPHGVRMVVEGRNWMGPRQANVRSCATCGGIGRISTRRYKRIENDYPVEDTGLNEVIW